MKNHTIKILTLFSLFIFIAMPDRVSSQSLTVSDTQIPYLAMAKGNSERSMIVSNPVLCKEVPGPCHFFIQHVQAHRLLNHLILPPNAYPASTEAKADCFAAYNSRGQDVLDTYKLLLNSDKASKYSIPGNLNDRAENIRTCAIKAKNWLGEVN